MENAIKNSFFPLFSSSKLLVVCCFAFQFNQMDFYPQPKFLHPWSILKILKNPTYFIAMIQNFWFESAQWIVQAQNQNSCFLLKKSWNVGLLEYKWGGVVL